MIYSENMESLGLYEDLSLFNGDLLLEDASQPAVVEDVLSPLGQSEQDGLFTIAPGNDLATSKVVSVTDTLAHPQKGSNDLGLVDLLGGSPTQDLPDPFTVSTAWMDTKADLLNVVTGTEQEVALQPVQQWSVSLLPQVLQQQPVTPEPVAVYPNSPEPAIVPNFTVDNSQITNDFTSDETSLEDIQDLLSDFPLVDVAGDPTANISGDSGIDLSSNVVFYPDSPQQSNVSVSDIDIMDQINEADLNALLSANPVGSMATSMLDPPILSPAMSADEVESLLSSSPSSPYSETAATTTALPSLFSSIADGSSTVSVLSPGELESCCPEVSSGSSRRSQRETVRHTPYPQPTTSTPVAAPSGKGRKIKGDRKERKKEQNRTAALRYREKKRLEGDTMMQEANELEAKNKVLRDKVDSITREINYLKDLMSEVRKVKAQNVKMSKSRGAS